VLRDQVYHQEEEEVVDPVAGILLDLLVVDSLLDLLVGDSLLDLLVGDSLPDLLAGDSLPDLLVVDILLDHPVGDILQLLAILQLQGILQPRGNLQLQEIQCLLPGEIHQRLQTLLQTGGRREPFVQRAADT